MAGVKLLKSEQGSRVALSRVRQEISKLSAKKAAP
jgi:hypothetical protein